MTSARWSEVRRLFHAAVELPLAGQHEFLRGQTADPSLIAEVERLLELHHESAFLDQAPSAALRLRGLAAAHLASGSVLASRFEIGRALGSGGMGEVYAAFDRDLSEEVAVKILRPGLEPDRLLQEVLTARRVTHPNVCRIFDIGWHEAMGFFTMELLQGITLANHLRDHGALPAQELVALFEQTTAGLRAAHEAGILHRDLKPANVMRVSPARFVIMDFGLAHRMEEGRTSASGPLAGTLGYMAPEVIAGRPQTVASDIYSLGILLHQAGTGAMPFDDNPLAAVLSGRGPHANVPALTPELRPAIARCLQLDPRERPASVDVLQKLARPKSRRWWLAGGAAATVAAFSSLGLSRFPSLIRFTPQKPDFGPVDHMLLTPIRNTTAQPRFDGVTALLSAQLEQSPRFGLIGKGRQGELLSRMNKRPSPMLEVPVVREMVLRQGSAAVVYGQVSTLGGDFVLDVKIEKPVGRPDNVPLVADRRFTAAGPEALLEGVRTAGQWIRETVGESEADRTRYNRPPSEISTPSWDALALYEQALEQKRSNPGAAIALFRESLRLDPGFASAHRDLADLMVSDGRLLEGYTQWGTAVEASRRRQLNSRERFRLEAAYLDDIQDLKAAEEVDRLWMAAYPRDYLPRFYLANICLVTGRLAEGLEIMRTAATFDRSSTAGARLAGHYLAQDRFVEAVQRIEETEAAGHKALASYLRGVLHLKKSQFAEALHWFQAAGKAGEVSAQFAAANVLVEMNRAQEAESYLEGLADADERAGQLMTRSRKLVTAGFIACRAGNVARGRQLVLRGYLPGRLLDQLTSLALARCGAKTEARQQLRFLDQLPAHPRFVALRESLRGELAVADGRIEDGVIHLRRADEAAPFRYLSDSLPRALQLAGRLTEAHTVYKEMAARLSGLVVTPARLAPGMLGQIALNKR